MDTELARHLNRRYAQRYFAGLKPGDLPAIFQELTANEKAKLVEAIAGRNAAGAGGVLIEAAQRISRAAAVSYVNGVETNGALTFDQARDLLL